MDCTTALHIYVVVLVIGLGASLLQEPKCPTPCSCNKFTISCRNKKLKELPTNFTISSTTETLDLSGNYFDSPSRADFNISGIQFVKNVYIHESSVELLSHDTFADLTSLEALDLSENNLEQVPSRLIQDNLHILVLKLSQNLFRKTPELISESLQVLDLSASHLQTFGEKNVINLPNLKHLYLHQNQLKFMSPNTFSLSHHLISVDLSYNNWRCNCSTAKLFDNLIERNVTKVEDPVRCRRTNKKFEDMYTKEGAVYSKKYCFNATIITTEVDKLNISSDCLKNLQKVREITNQDDSKSEEMHIETSTSEKLVQNTTSEGAESSNLNHTFIYVIVGLVVFSVTVIIVVTIFFIKHSKKKFVYQGVSSNSFKI